MKKHGHVLVLALKLKHPELISTKALAHNYELYYTEPILSNKSIDSKHNLHTGKNDNLQQE